MKRILIKAVNVLRLENKNGKVVVVVFLINEKQCELPENTENNRTQYNWCMLVEDNYFS